MRGLVAGNNYADLRRVQLQGCVSDLWSLSRLGCLHAFPKLLPSLRPSPLGLKPLSISIPNGTAGSRALPKVSALQKSPRFKDVRVLRIRLYAL